MQGWYFQDSPGRVLDYGCGTGVNLIFLAERGYRGDGVDASQEAIALVARKLKERPDIGPRIALTHISADSTRLPFDDGTFDYVVCVSVLSLLGWPARVTKLLEEFRRVMKPGAKMIVDVNGPTGDFARSGRLVDEDVYYVEGEDGLPFHCYCPADQDRFVKVLSPHFEVDDIGYTGHRYMGREDIEFIACARKAT